MTLIVCPNCQQRIQGVTVHILAPFEDGECPHCGKGFVISVAAQHVNAADLANASQNLLALLEECYENGNTGETQLYAWFSDQAEIIEQAIEEARQEPPSR
jgi:hypothetical protein